ncbi:DUF3164 family protein [Iodobacter fluviatilis]|uniref:Protein of uncharacterized function (DUF3164) n=1 Tax=Iodobacter fluviatilis TaxID=537 RepID=A0A377Q9I4_9NEIS|nr:DUF3164 family protein [Iodobacter fluviatilis]TCU88564.1 uncharacterized protein DUF3164 [Iodobacter fluviatilis]STQ91365.1 Protein of uncharacterised function (DUF3164) [Iodobacter fluviatilis]
MKPEDFMEDAKGRFIPVASIKEIDIERDKLVKEIVGKAKEMRDLLRKFKLDLMGDVEAFCDLSFERYNAPIGGKKGNVTLTTFDGKYKVVRAMHDVLTFDEGLQAAKALIDECVNSWSEGANPNIRVLVNDAFQVDKEGKISAGRVLGLRRLQMVDATGKWELAMLALGESLRVQGTVPYIRVYERVGKEGKYEAISLDVAGV